jgi:predicted MFS family arabinose efflux permease
MSEVNVNSRSAIVSAMILGTVGVLSFIVQPGLVQGFVTELGLSEAQANGLAFSEMIGVALATVVIVVVGRFVNWRLLLTIGLLLSTFGNLVSSLMGTESELNVVRFVTGLGEGVIISLSFTFIGLTTRTDRNLALYLVLLLSYGALGLWVMPSILSDFGISAIFAAWAVISGLALLIVKYVPKSSNDSVKVSPESVQMHWGLIAVAVFGCLVFNTAIGLAWANLFLIGMEIRADEQSIANALLVSQFVAIPGALLAFLLAGKISRWVLMTFGILAAAASIAMLLGKPEYIIFLVAISAFNFIWNLVLPFIISAISDMDMKGRAMSVAIACQLIGIGFGPGIASIILEDRAGFEGVKILTVLLLLSSLVIFAIPVSVHYKVLKELKAKSI